MVFRGWSQLFTLQLRAVEVSQYPPDLNIALRCGTSTGYWTTCHDGTGWVAPNAPGFQGIPSCTCQLKDGWNGFGMWGCGSENGSGWLNMIIICMSSCSVILFQNFDISDDTPSRWGRWFLFLRARNQSQGAWGIPEEGQSVSCGQAFSAAAAEEMKALGLSWVVVEASGWFLKIVLPWFSSRWIVLDVPIFCSRKHCRHRLVLEMMNISHYFTAHLLTRAFFSPRNWVSMANPHLSRLDIIQNMVDLWAMLEGSPKKSNRFFDAVMVEKMFIHINQKMIPIDTLWTYKKKRTI